MSAPFRKIDVGRAYATDTYMGIIFTAIPTGDTQTYQYEISMTANATTGTAESSTTRIAVSANTPPTAEAGPAQNVPHQSAVTLYSAGSNANDVGQSLTYLWSQTSGTLVSLSSTTAASPTFTAPTLAIGAPNSVLVFSLTVNDGIDSSVADTVTITVAAPANTAPTAHAGPGQTVASAAAVTLDGSGSDANDAGQSLLYFWSQTAGTSVTLSNAAGPNPSFTAPTIAAGGADETLTFALFVFDGVTISSTSTVDILVEAPAANTPASADAGSDQGVASAASVTLDGSGSDANDAGQMLTYAWSQTGGTGVTLSSATAQSPSFTAPTLAIGAADEALTFSLVVNDGFGASGADTVVITVSAEVDNGRPTVVLSGMPDKHDGATAFNLTATFSESVTGFETSDVSVQHGTITSISGSGSAYSLVVVPSSATKAVSVRVKANGARDAAGNANKTSAKVSIEADVVSVAQSEIKSFMEQRAKLLSRAQPKLARFLGAGGGNFDATATATRADLSFSSLMDRRVWANAMGLWSTEDGDEQSYAHLSFGSHFVMTENLIIGGMVQFDQSDATLADGIIESKGFLVGPYAVAKMADQPLIFSASLLRGTSQNEITLTDLPTDTFKSTRTLATIGVEGTVDLGSGILMVPSVDLFYLLDQQHSYIDSADNNVPEQEVAMTSATLGLGFEIPLSLDFVEATLRPSVNATFAKTRNSDGVEESTRWGVDLGATFEQPSGAIIAVDLFYDGIGEQNAETYGGSILYEIKF